jgi:hypothetical protein
MRSPRAKVDRARTCRARWRTSEDQSPLGSIGENDEVPDVVRLTVVGSQGEADVICALLRAHGVHCAERSLQPVDGGGGWGGWREVLVGDDDLDAARELPAATPLAD